MKKRKIYCFLFCYILLLILCNGCKKKEGVSGQGSVRFANITMEIEDDGNEYVFASSGGRKFEIQIVDRWKEYGAVYHGKIYYLDHLPSVTVGLLPTKEKQMICCQGLREGDDAATIVLEITDDFEEIAESFIQEGLLYCSWKTKENINKHVVVNLDSETVREFFVPEGKTVEAVTTSGYYYLQDGKIYFSKYEGGRDKLFFETDGQVCEMYRDGENFCAFVEREDGISVAVLNKKGKQQEEYGGIDQVEGLQKGYHPVFLKEKNGILYYLLTAKKEGTSYNTWLIRADLEAGDRTNCGGWYVKQEN